MLERILEQIRADLERARRDPASWASLAFDPLEDEEGGAIDRAELARARVIWAMEYDRRPEDLPLARFLLEQEALRAEDGRTMGGMGDEMLFVGARVASLGDAADVWLLHQAKYANFDTGCGFSLEHLFAPGVQAVLAEVRASDRPERDAVLASLLDEAGQPRCSDAEAQERTEWLLRDYFREDPGQESLLTWSDRARRMGDAAAARGLLEAWARGRPRDEDTLSSLRYHLEELGDYAGAARAQRERVPLRSEPFDRASALVDLARLSRLAGDPPAALDACDACEVALAEVPGWRECGLGRHFVEELFHLAAAADPADARALLARADALAVPRMSMVNLRAAVLAAERAGDRDRLRRYKRRLARERRRIEREL